MTPTELAARLAAPDPTHEQVLAHARREYAARAWAHCHTCEAALPDPFGTNGRCSGCKRRRFCGVPCFKYAWPRHMDECLAWRAEAAAAAAEAAAKEEEAAKTAAGPAEAAPTPLPAAAAASATAAPTPAERACNSCGRLPAAGAGAFKLCGGCHGTRTSWSTRSRRSPCCRRCRARSESALKGFGQRRALPVCEERRKKRGARQHFTYVGTRGAGMGPSLLSSALSSGSRSTSTSSASRPSSVTLSCTRRTPCE